MIQSFFFKIEISTSSRRCQYAATAIDDRQRRTACRMFRIFCLNYSRLILQKKLKTNLMCVFSIDLRVVGVGYGSRGFLNKKIHTNHQNNEMTGRIMTQ